METNKQIGLMVMVAVALILGVILLTASAQQIGDVTNTVNLANQSLGASLTNGTPLYVTNCRHLSSVKVFNATGDVEVPSTNYTITNNVVDTSGNLAVKVTPVVVGTVGGYQKGTPTIQAVCQPTTYDDSAGGRAVAGIIIILFAIALAVVALYPTLKEAGYLGYR